MSRFVYHNDAADAGRLEQVGWGVIASVHTIDEESLARLVQQANSADKLRAALENLINGNFIKHTEGDHYDEACDALEQDVPAPVVYGPTAPYRLIILGSGGERYSEGIQAGTQAALDRYAYWMGQIKDGSGDIAKNAVRIRLWRNTRVIVEWSLKNGHVFCGMPLGK